MAGAGDDADDHAGDVLPAGDGEEVMVILVSGQSAAYPCSFCQRHQPMAGSWEHGFGWSRCPECVAAQRCKRCKIRDARPNYQLCKQCNDDDDAAMLAAYMCVG